MLPPQESCEFIDSSKPLNVMSLPCRFEMISGMYLGEIVRLILVKKMVVLRGEIQPGLLCRQVGAESLETKAAS